MNLKTIFEFASQVGFARWLYRYCLWQFRKRILCIDSWLILPTGRKLFLPRSAGAAAEVFVTNADCDWGSEYLFSELASPDDDFIDVGAHVGYYSVYLSPLVHKVYAFEPNPQNHPALELNAANNSNIVLKKKAVSNSSGVAVLNISGNSAISHITYTKSDSTIDVSTTTIDEFVERLRNPNIKLIKIDAEGHDLNVVEGCINTIQQSQPLILMEFTTGEGSKNDVDQLNKICNELGYKIFAFTKETYYQRSSTLREITTQEIGQVKAKMLFLTPERLQEKFRSASQ